MEFSHPTAHQIYHRKFTQLRYWHNQIELVTFLRRKGTEYFSIVFTNAILAFQLYPLWGIFHQSFGNMPTGYSNEFIFFQRNSYTNSLQSFQSPTWCIFSIFTKYWNHLSEKIWNFHFQYLYWAANTSSGLWSISAARLNASHSCNETQIRTGWAFASYWA